MPEAEARAAMLKIGMSEWLIDAILEDARAQRDGKLDSVSDDVERLVGRPARSLDAFLREHAGAFLPPEAKRPAPAP